MNNKDRILLRDKLINELKNKKIIIINKNEICTYIKRKLDDILKCNEIIYKDYNDYKSQFRSEKEAMYCLIHQDDFENHICPICNKNICIFDTSDKKYRKTCSKKCAEKISNSKEAKEKAKQTTKLHYGVENASQSELIKIRKKETTLKHYNVESPMQSIQIKEKIKNKNLKLYNVENQTQKHIKNYDIWNDEEKFKQYIIDKYNEKGTLLFLNEIYGFFNVSRISIKNHIKKFNLLDYFYIPKSELEIDFMNFLIDNKIKYKKK